MVKMSSFYTRLKEFDPLRIVKSKDFIATLILLLITTFLHLDYFYTINMHFVDTIINISTALISFIIAAFAIIISLTDKKFIEFLKQAQVYDKVLFLLEWNIVIAFLTIFLAICSNYIFSSIYTYQLTIFLFIYMVFSILNLVSFMTDYGIIRGNFEIRHKKSKTQKQTIKKNV